MFSRGAGGFALKWRSKKCAFFVLIIALVKPTLGYQFPPILLSVVLSLFVANPFNETSELFRRSRKGPKGTRKLVAEGGFDEVDYFKIKSPILTPPL